MTIVGEGLLLGSGIGTRLVSGGNKRRRKPRANIYLGSVPGNVPVARRRPCSAILARRDFIPARDALGLVRHLSIGGIGLHPCMCGPRRT